MRTVITGMEIETGYYTIVGFGEPSIDGEATKRKIKPILENTEAGVALKELQVQLEKNQAEYQTERSRAHNAKTKNNKVVFDEAIEKGKLLQQKRQELAGQLAAYQTINRKRRQELIVSDPVYCHPRAGEIIITDQQAVEFSEKIKDFEDGQIFCLHLNEAMTEIIGEKILNRPQG